MFKNASHAPSFKVIVSYYKPSRSILNFFELILKAYTQGVPNRTAIFQDWAPVLYMMPLSSLVDRRKDFFSGSRDPISLSANFIASIADKCAPSQIICDSDLKILDIFDIFEDRSLQSI